MCVYHQSEYADNCTDAVDRLLILNWLWQSFKHWAQERNKQDQTRTKYENIDHFIIYKGSNNLYRLTNPNNVQMFGFVLTRPPTPKLEILTGNLGETTHPPKSERCSDL